MSVATLETPVLDFTASLVEQAANEVLGVSNITDIRRADVADMKENDLAVFNVFSAVVERGLKEKDEAWAKASVRGFLLGNRAVHYASHDVTLGPRPIEAAQNYYELVLTNGRRLDKDFARDYAHHPAVIELVDKSLGDKVTQAHAKLVFNLFGKEANPNRPPIEIPVQRRLKGNRDSRRQFIGAASASVRQRGR